MIRVAVRHNPVRTKAKPRLRKRDAGRVPIRPKARRYVSKKELGMYVYVIACKSGQIKVGVTISVKHRLKQLQRKMALPLYIAHTWNLPGVRKAWELERFIHDSLDAYSLGHEWFRCIPEYAVVAGLNFPDLPE